MAADPEPWRRERELPPLHPLCWTSDGQRPPWSGILHWTSCPPPQLLPRVSTWRALTKMLSLNINVVPGTRERMGVCGAGSQRATIGRQGRGQTCLGAGMFPGGRKIYLVLMEPRMVESLPCAQGLSPWQDLGTQVLVAQDSRGHQPLSSPTALDASSIRRFPG